MRHINEIFPGYRIIQDDEYFKLSQDTVLLSDFARLRRGERGLDLGAGVGCLAILMLLRGEGEMTALELQAGACAIARENLAMCGLDARGEVLEADFRALPAEMRQKYDVCASNPPYFSAARGGVSPSPTLAAARSESTGGVAEVCAAAGAALRGGGRFYVCYRPERLGSLFAALAAAGLTPKRMRAVYPSPERPAILVLLEAVKHGGEGLQLLPPLLVRDESGAESAEYQAIYGGRRYDR